MKKSTKYLLIIAILAIVIGAAGVGIGIGQVSKDRLDVDLALNKEAEELTLEVDNKTSMYFHITPSENSQITIQDQFMPTNATYDFTEKGKEAQLTFSIDRKSSLPEDVHLGIGEGNEIQLTIPDTIKKITIRSNSNHRTYLNLSLFSLDNLSLETTKTETTLSENTIRDLTISAGSGSVFLSNNNITGKTTAESNSANIIFDDNTLSEEANLLSESGNLQLFNVTAKKLSLESKKGNITLEEVKAPLTAISETGDIHHAASKLTDDIELTSKNGKVVSVLKEQAKSQAEIKVKNSPDVLLFNKDKMTFGDEKSEHKMTLQSDMGVVRVYQLIPIGYDEEEGGEIQLDNNADKEMIDHYRIDGNDEEVMEDSLIDFHNNYWPEDYRIFDIYYHY